MGIFDHFKENDRVRITTKHMVLDFVVGDVYYKYPYGMRLVSDDEEVVVYDDDFNDDAKVEVLT